MAHDTDSRNGEAHADESADAIEAMILEFTLPGLVGAGSQPGEEDGAELDFLPMPKGIRTYAMPAIPEKDEAGDIGAGLAVLTAVQQALAEGQLDARFDLHGLDVENRRFIDQVLGEGEVSIVAGDKIQAQESVLAGVWRLHELDGTGQLASDRIALGAFPSAVADIARAAASPTLTPDLAVLTDDVINAPALVTELADHVAAWQPGTAPHVINLSLLPLTQEDMAFIQAHIGRGVVTILSRGYGNCRITSTGVRNVWWVQYFNSAEILILNTLEVTDMPSVACAAPEDLEDSATRLHEILEVYR